MLDTPLMLWELSMTEQRYRAVLEVLAGVPAVLEDLVRAVRPARLPWLPRDTSRGQDDPGPGQAGHHRGVGGAGAGHHWKNHESSSALREPTLSCCYSPTWFTMEAQHPVSLQGRAVGPSGRTRRRLGSTGSLESATTAITHAVTVAGVSSAPGIWVS